MAILHISNFLLQFDLISRKIFGLDVMILKTSIFLCKDRFSLKDWFHKILIYILMCLLMCDLLSHLSGEHYEGADTAQETDTGHCQQ